MTSIKIGLATLLIFACMFGGIILLFSPAARQQTAQLYSAAMHSENDSYDRLITRNWKLSPQSIWQMQRKLNGNSLTQTTMENLTVGFSGSGGRGTYVQTVGFNVQRGSWYFSPDRNFLITRTVGNIEQKQRIDRLTSNELVLSLYTNGQQIEQRWIPATK